MGTNGGNALGSGGGHEMGGMGPGSNQPQATEYTLQGGLDSCEGGND